MPPKRIIIDTDIGEPLRFTSVFSDGHHIYAVRFATDDKPPSLYWRETGKECLVVSEPLDDDQGEWQEVPPGQVLVTERRGELEILPFAAETGVQRARARLRNGRLRSIR